ncbi:MAG: LysE family transporter [Ignavibacteria bacterium]|nr:LysE family transporter [Ignavibacteria bacterium]
MITGLLLGICIGFIFSMPPLGPTYFAIIEKGLKKEFNNAVSIGIGAGIMDMVYILVAFGGVSVITAFFPDSVNSFFASNEVTIKYYLAIGGCILIIFYGIKIISIKKIPEKPVSEETEIKIKQKLIKVQNVLKITEVKLDKLLHTHRQEKPNSAIFGSLMFGVLSCLSSPTLPASWFATVGYLKSYGLISSGILSGFFLAFGVLAGTSLWFYVMTKLIFRHTDKINPGIMKKLNIFTGSFLIIIGAVFLYRTVF